MQVVIPVASASRNVFVVSELEMITIKWLHISYVIENYLCARLQNLSHVQIFCHKK